MSEPLHIVHFPHPVLRTVSKPLERIDANFQSTIRGMFELMYAARGIGLAANQVGLPFRFFILNLTADPEQKDQEQVFINPEIVKRHSSDEAEEGCLSLPGVYAKVRRPKRIRVRAYSLKGELVELDTEGLHARAIQHELDHLDGKLFIDYLGVLTRAGLARQIRKFESEYAEAQKTGSLGHSVDLEQKIRELMADQGVPAPVLPPRLPVTTERPSESRSTTSGTQEASS
ncbi:MAG: Peptide deformylase [Planctomycetota bacterium]|jgi:peptide deformylase